MIKQYQKQIQVKRDIVADALSRVGKLSIIPETTLASPLEYNYRNKVDFSFQYKENLKIGFRPREDFEKTLEIENCLLFDDRHEKLLHSIRKLLDKKVNRNLWIFYEKAALLFLNFRL